MYQHDRHVNAGSGSHRADVAYLKCGPPFRQNKRFLNVSLRDKRRRTLTSNGAEIGKHFRSDNGRHTISQGCRLQRDRRTQ
jgi:hypothetical protein